MHIKKTLLFLLLTTTLCFGWSQNTATLDYSVRRLRMEPDMKHASLAVCVHDITHDSTIYAIDADHALLPAALNKMFTTAAGFSRLGKDFRFKTDIAFSGNIEGSGVLNGNIYILGYGDPFLGSTRIKGTSPDVLFRDITEAIRNKGIKRINGHIYADATLYNDEVVHSTWQWEDIGNYYGAGVCAINYHENTIDFHLSAGKEVGDSVVITSIYPKELPIRIDNFAVTGPRDTASSISFYGSPTENVRTCRGVLALGTHDTLIRASLPNPPACLAHQLTQYLRKHGIPVSGEASDRIPTPNHLQMITDIQTLYYSDIAKLTNYTTNNMCAESIFKYLGYFHEGAGTYANGQRFMNLYFHELGLDPAGVKMVDGSGLSRDNHVTANFVCQFLAAISQQSYFNDFCATLGISSQTRDTRVIPRIPDNATLVLKSGSMRGIRCYAGYYTNPAGTKYCFSILSNNYDCDANVMNHFLKNIIEEIVKF